MPEVTTFQPGSFCWVDLGTTNVAEAIGFYTGLFGWEAASVPAGPGMTYVMLRKGGQEVAALYEMASEMRAQGVPPAWLSYVAVADADAAAKACVDAGGKVVAPPFDVEGSGRMATLQDPTGAVFAVWQATRDTGYRRIGETGAVCWNELATRDTQAAARFYASVFGWRAEQPGEPWYTQFFLAGEESRRGGSAAGMMALAEHWGPVPAHWLTYFGVDDCDASVARAQALGGVVKVPCTDVAGVGRFAVLADPAGAIFAILALESAAA
jgi:predicted enzyme related to lactoylglutathione lyase